MHVGLRELCSKFCSLCYSEFPLKITHYAHYHSFYAPHCHYYSIVPIANDIQCTSVVTSCVYVYNNIIQVVLHKLHNIKFQWVLYCRSFDIVL